jgi:hypothetical protein
MTNPKTKISDKAQLAVEHYIANMIIAPVVGYNWRKACIEAGYSHSYIRSSAKLVWDNEGVQSQIAASKAQIGIKAETIREEVTRMFRRGYEIAEDQSNPAGVSANAVGLARMNGLLTDNVNTENKVLGINVIVKD